MMSEHRQPKWLSKLFQLLSADSPLSLAVCVTTETLLLLSDHQHCVTPHEYTTSQLASSCIYLITINSLIGFKKFNQTLYDEFCQYLDKIFNISIISFIHSRNFIN